MGPPIMPRPIQPTFVGKSDILFSVDVVCKRRNSAYACRHVSVVGSIHVCSLRNHIELRGIVQPKPKD